MSRDPISQHYRLKKPCANCPFLKEGAIDLRPGRLEGIVSELESDDTATFMCHKTVHTSKGGSWSEDGHYQPSGHEAMCAGAVAYLLKVRRPTIGMRLAFMGGEASPEQWDEAKTLVIDPPSREMADEETD